MKITTGQAAEIIGVSGATAAKTGRTGLWGPNLGSSARPKWDLETVQAVAERPDAPAPPPDERIVVVTLGAPTQEADGRWIGWNEKWSPDRQRLAAAGAWQAPRGATAVVAAVAGIVVGVWRTKGPANVDASGFATYDLAELEPVDPLREFTQTRLPIRRGPNRYELRRQ